MRQRISRAYLKILWVGIATILVIAPFYAPLSVLAASHLHHFDFFKIWKEIALTVLGIVLGSFLFAHRRFARRMLRNRLLAIIGLYIALLIVIGLYDLLTHRVSQEAVIYGLLVNIRPVGFFAVAILAFSLGSEKNIGHFPWRRIILLPALAVVLFGLLQLSLLPNDALTHIGYGKSTILPYGTIDNQPNLVRIESTLRGPNPLGAYLLVIITLLAGLFFAAKDRWRLVWGVFILGGLAVLYGTYSRSAEVGLILSLIALVIVQQRQFVKRHLIVVLATGALVLGGGILAVATENYYAQNVLFHSSDKSTSRVSSNTQRLDAIKRGAKDVWHHPLGSGVGSAGPASLRNEKSGGRIAENYFLQIGQEVGIVGLALFIAINVVAGIELWHRRQNLLPAVLLAALVGLSFVNLLSHAWTDDTLAYIWWGLAGFALAPAILAADKRKQNGKTDQKPA